MTKPGPNDPCPCGSGKKTKKCCGVASTGPRPRLVAWADPVDRLSNRVPELLEQGRVDEALRVARQLLDRYPDEPDGLERMAEVLEARGDRQGAAAWYRRASRHHLERDPDYGAEPAEHYAALADRLDPEGHPPAEEPGPT